MQKIYKDTEIGEVIFKKSLRAKRMTLKVHPTKGVSLTYPTNLSLKKAESFFLSKRDWVLETIKRQLSKFEELKPASEEEIETMRKEAKKALPPRLDYFAQKHGFHYNRVAIKHNSTNWGSCSKKNNINLNLNLVRLPQALSDYVLLHELSHLRHHNHGHGFYLLLETLCSENLRELIDAGDKYALDLARQTLKSRAKFPIAFTMNKEIKKYRLL